MIWLLGFLLFQLIIPLTYYLRDDPYDERFAWRMFSAVRLHSCRTTSTETIGENNVSIPLHQVIHRAWSNHLSRNRASVVHAFLRWRCAEEEVNSVQLRNECTTPSGQALQPQIYELDCRTGKLEEPETLIVQEIIDEEVER